MTRVSSPATKPPSAVRVLDAVKPPAHSYGTRLDPRVSEQAKAHAREYLSAHGA